MNLKDILMVTAFAFLSMMVVDRLILSRFAQPEQEEVRSGQTFSAPQTNQVIRPINTEIDFIDDKRVYPEVVTEVQTAWAKLTFSSDGASLERLEFIREESGQVQHFVTVHPAVSREQKAFLVALDEKTPYFFKLVERKEHEHATELIYEGSFGDGILRKHFIIQKEICKIDMQLDITPQAHVEREVRTRVFYPAPLMPELKKDQMQGLVADSYDAVTKTPVANVDVQQGWWSPTLFGAENRYFVHALVADQESSLERAYYTITPEKLLISILECRSAQAGHTNESMLSFYCGPKDAHSMALVDVRLEQTLDYSGWLAPLAKLLLKLLNTLYSYVHNYGVAIILLTLLIKLVMLPFSLSGERKMRSGKDMSKKMQHLQRKYKNDPERLRLEQAELIKKHGMPQLAGCLPQLAQVPIFFALSRILGNAIELYKAPFVGWIQDLSAPDPYYIMPSLIAIAMVFQALQADAKLRMPFMAGGLFLGAVSANFSAGLVLYIAFSSLLGVAQSKLQKRMV